MKKSGESYKKVIKKKLSKMKKYKKWKKVVGGDKKLTIKNFVDGRKSKINII